MQQMFILFTVLSNSEGVHLMVVVLVFLHIISQGGWRWRCVSEVRAKLSVQFLLQKV